MDLKNKAFNTFADWIETKNNKKQNFKEWYQAFWPEYSTRCYDICRNIYIMEQCIHIFERKLVKNTTWKESFHKNTLWKEINQLCISMEIDPDDFFDKNAQTVYEKKCHIIWNRYFGDESEYHDAQKDDASV